MKRQLSFMERLGKAIKPKLRASMLDELREYQVRMLLEHEVPFSIECYGECQGQTSGDDLMGSAAMASGDCLTKAKEAGWTCIEPVSGSETSHFRGLCPACTKVFAEDAST
jgi:hypothetical protein